MVFVTDISTQPKARPVQSTDRKLVRVLLADDHAKVRAAIRKLINHAPELVVVGESENGLQALEMVEALDPDVLILDMEMPILNGAEVAARLKAQRSRVKILAVSAYEDRQYILGLLENGASGYMTKDEAPDMLVTAVRGVAEGKHGWVSQRVANLIGAWKPAQPATQATLTLREAEILKLLADRKTDLEISAEMGLDQRLVERFISLLSAKLGVASRTELIVLARKH